jgi:hypothetical protein
MPISDLREPLLRVSVPLAQRVVDFGIVFFEWHADEQDDCHFSTKTMPLGGPVVALAGDDAVPIVP